MDNMLLSVSRLLPSSADDAGDQSLQSLAYRHQTTGCDHEYQGATYIDVALAVAAIHRINASNQGPLGCDA